MQSFFHIGQGESRHMHVFYTLDSETMQKFSHIWKADVSAGGSFIFHEKQDILSDGRSLKYKSLSGWNFF